MPGVIPRLLETPGPIENLGPALGGVLLAPEHRDRSGKGQHNLIACPLGNFRTKDDQWVAIARTTNKLFEALALAMDRPELATDARYGEHTKRLECRHAVNEIVSAWWGAAP